MVTKTVVHFEIPASDLAALSKFYADVFGWEFKKAAMPDMEYWQISTGPRGKSVPGGMYKKAGPTCLGTTSASKTLTSTSQPSRLPAARK
jgi:predicted enzyme related to lactoylglutathione lyase